MTVQWRAGDCVGVCALGEEGDGGETERVDTWPFRGEARTGDHKKILVLMFNVTVLQHPETHSFLLNYLLIIRESTQLKIFLSVHFFLIDKKKSFNFFLSRRAGIC